MQYPSSFEENHSTLFGTPESRDYNGLPIIECEIPVNIDGFTGWLSGFVSKNTFLSQMTSKDFFWCLNPNPTVKNDLGNRIFNIEVKLYNSIFPEVNSEHLIGAHPIITVRTWEIGNNRIGILVNLWIIENDFVSLVEEFKNDISSTWPETLRQLFNPEKPSTLDE